VRQCFYFFPSYNRTQITENSASGELVSIYNAVMDHRLFLLHVKNGSWNSIAVGRRGMALRPPRRAQATVMPAAEHLRRRSGTRCRRHRPRGLSPFFSNYTIHRRHSQRTHTHPYEYTHANPTLRSIFEIVPANPRDSQSHHRRHRELNSGPKVVLRLL
jgi:hypothetical protein